MRIGRTRAAGAALILLVGGGTLASGGMWSVQGATPDGGYSADEDGWWAKRAAHPHAVVAKARKDAASRGNTTLTFIESYEGDSYQVVGLPVGEPDGEAGDGVLFEAPLLNQAGTRQVGLESVRCMLGFEGVTCESTLLVHGRGKIRAAGTMFGGDDATIAVTGGTGRFHAARGQLTSTLIDDTSALVVVELVN
jgi:hypothetical protein